MPSQSPFQLLSEASDGFADASSYDTHRPSYPSTVVARFLQELQVAEQLDAKIVDVGAGTGKFTALLAAREEGYEVRAVEPHGEMRKELEEKRFRGVKVVEGDAARMEIEDGWGDAAVAAQAFHWFANEDALREIHRVLRPGAVFGMIWNIEDYNAPSSWPATTKWEQALNEIIFSLDDGHPRFRHQKWKQVFEKQLDTTPLQTLRDTFTHNMPEFSLPLGEAEERWTVWLTEEGLWQRWATLSQIAVLEGEKLQSVRKRFEETLKGDDVERNEKGELAVHGRTFWAWTSRV